MTSNGRVARLTALALATGTLVAVGAGTAGAANTSTTTYTTRGGGSVIHLEVNLPVAVPGVPQRLVQDIVMTGTSTRSGATPASLANAFLGQESNNIPIVSDLLAQRSTAEYGKATTGDQNYATALNGLGISGKLLALKSSALNPNTNGTVASGDSAIADLRVDGGANLNLQLLLDALGAQLAGLLTTVKLPASIPAADGTLTNTTTTVTGLLTALSNQVADLADSSTGNASKPFTNEQRAALAKVSDLLGDLPAALTGQLKLVAADSSLLHVGLIQSTNEVTRKADVVTNKTTNTLTGIEVLGGLVTVEGLSSKASASLGPDLSSATPKTTTASNLLSVNAADLLKVDVTDRLDAVLSSGVLPASVTDPINGVLAQVTALVSDLLGANLTLGKVTENIETADKAAATVSAATLTIDPRNPLTGARLLPMDSPLVTIDFVPATAEVLKGQSSVPPVKVTKPGAVTAESTLARTGMDLPLTGAVAVALMGLATIARRRRGLADS